jgi:hypothetical protein
VGVYGQSAVVLQARLHLAGESGFRCDALSVEPNANGMNACARRGQVQVQLTMYALTPAGEIGFAKSYVNNHAKFLVCARSLHVHAASKKAEISAPFIRGFRMVDTSRAAMNAAGTTD